MPKAKKVQLLTFRQYLFLKWLFNRRVRQQLCDLRGSDIQCFNCLENNGECKKGLMPASFFYKKIGRQYIDCKRVLDSLKKKKLIDEIHTVNGKLFHLFYIITDTGIEFLKTMEESYWIN